VPRRVKNLFVVYLISFNLVAVAQDTSYSTDSLMAAFSKGSHSSLKGSEITVNGVVAEIKKSRVVFKSLGNDKVICELVSSIAIEAHPVGSSLTVVGKVRGRGMLGNVTLDQCNLASSNIASTEPAPIEPPLEPSEEQITEVGETTPAVVADAVPATPNLPTGFAQAPKTLLAAAPNKTVSANELVESNPGITTSEQPHKVVQEDSNSLKTVSRVFGATVVVLLAIGALLAFVKLRPAIAAGLRPPTFPTTDAMRRAALESLLSKDKKQK
jgi:hypothetical protein